MTDYRAVLEHDLDRVGPADFTLDDVARRRSRKRRNQRVAAGVVGLAVFVAAVWIVTSVGSLDRGETTVGPAGGVTGPTQTGPTGTSPTEWDGYGIPPEGTAVSTPVEGRPILQQSYGGEVLLGEKTVACPTGCRKWYHTFRIVYADGRVLWWGSLRRNGGGDYVKERRLTPEGVDLVRSGVDPADVPDSAWADAEARPYAPTRYSICFGGNGMGDAAAMDRVRAADLLPEAAKRLLTGSPPDPLHPGCLIVSTEDARALHDILSEEGLSNEGLNTAPGVGVTPGDTVASWLLPDAERVLGEQVGIYLHPLWPDGDWHRLCCA